MRTTWQTIQQRARERKEMVALGLDPDTIPDRRLSQSNDGEAECTEASKGARMILRPELAGAVFNTPLLMHPGKLDAALAGIGERIVEGGVALQRAGERIDHVAFEHRRPLAGRIGDKVGRMLDDSGRQSFAIIDGVALIPIEGTLVHKGAYVGAYSGRTSYGGLQAQVLRALRNPAIKGMVFEVDSFGGELAGAFETADLIARLSAGETNAGDSSIMPSRPAICSRPRPGRSSSRSMGAPDRSAW